MDKIPTPEEFIKQKMYIVHKLSNKEQPIEIGDVIETSERLSELISEYTKQVVKYTLEQAAKEIRSCVQDISQYPEDGYIVTREPILALEDQIIKDLKL